MIARKKLFFFFFFNILDTLCLKSFSMTDGFDVERNALAPPVVIDESASKTSSSGPSLPVKRMFYEIDTHTNTCVYYSI
jgi:hypothetical protein